VFEMRTDDPGSTAPSIWRSLRWPLVILVVAVVLYVVATVLDQGSERQRDIALLLGVPALYLLLPLAVIWIGIVVIRHLLRR
jgi:NAD-dependent oxidoreductase involved in siderophore biosynthesis